MAAPNQKLNTAPLIQHLTKFDESMQILGWGRSEEEEVLGPPLLVDVRQRAASASRGWPGGQGKVGMGAGLPAR